MAVEPNGNQVRANGNGDSLEKDFSNQHHLNDTNMSGDDALRRIRTAGSISISPELFEKLYLSPQNAVKGDLRKTFGNPTPIALLGFLLALSPLSCDLMGWRGSGGSGAAAIGAYFFFGGLLMLVGGFLEFILGNTFPSVVFMAFGAFWLTFGSTLQPFYFAYGSYSPTTTPADGLQTVGFTASFGFFLIFMALLSFIFLICSLRTNICFVVIFFTLTLGFSLLAGAYWQSANGIGRKDASAIALAGRLQIAGGASLFVTSMAGWWIFFAIMLAALDFPFQIPVGDLSTLIKGASTRQKEKENMV
ncbi:Protein alcS [Lachnellula hyalina]|uniref:Protein alcS n=1 Tax=Lachnellula hyalina TaxID=1316788 RepID=A0A8H8U114_9HELO|nr:Protein alcS [Lachnellula hyalina]TVY29548.1 Protein alcS [Lachnellula hyalina]